MSRSICQGRFVDQSGNIVPDGSVTVFLAGTTTQALIYTQLAGGSSTYFVTTDVEGRFFFYVDDSDYLTSQRFKVVLSKGGYETQTYDQMILFGGTLDHTASLVTSIGSPGTDTNVPSEKAVRTAIEVGVTYTNVKYPEYGAIGNGSHDDTSAIAAAITACPNGGVIFFPPGNYLISNYLNITVSYLGILGCGMNNSKITSNSTTLDVLRFTGAIGSPISNNFARDITLTRQSSTPSAGTGVALSYTSQPLIQNVEVRNAVKGVSISNTNNLHAEGVWVFRTAGSDTCYGFYFDGTAVSSLVMKRCLAYFPGQTGTNYGVYLFGTAINDSFFDTVETSACVYGYYIGSGGVTNYDVQIINPIVDQFTNSGIYIANNTTADTMLISILGGWTNPKNTGATTYNMNFASASGISVSAGHQFFAGTNYANATGLYINGSNRVSCIGNKFRDFLYGVSSASTNLMNKVDLNDFYNVSGQAATTMINCVSMSRGTILGNVFDGYATNGIVLNANSNDNEVLGNVFNPGSITNKITDNGISNDVAHNITA